MPRTTIVSEDDYLITLHQPQERKSDKLIINFGGVDSKLTPAGFGTDWCMKYGFDSLYVAQQAGTQYQRLSLEAFADAVAPVINGREVVCYGSSLGAYSSLYYGGILNARIVAASPMLPAWPALKRKKFAVPVVHRAIKDTPLSRRSPIVIYDPHVRDDRTIMTDLVLPAYPNARIIEVPYGGHAVLKAISQVQRLSPIIHAMIEDDQIIDIRMPDDTSHQWLLQRAMAIRSKEPGLAQHYFEKALAILPNQSIISNLVKHLLQNKQLAEAEQHILKALGSGDRRLRIAPPVLDRARELGIEVPQD